MSTAAGTLPAPPPPAPPQGDSRPYLALGLTFLLLGIGFANPFPLVQAFPRGMWEGQISREALNLYALTAFLGWAHFFYAWQGQWRGTARLLPTRRYGYWAIIVLLLTVLVAVRSMLGVGVFSLVTWVYNIAHFIKAEAHFAGPREHLDEGLRRRPRFQSPAVAFAWFTLVLFQVGPLGRPLLVFSGTLALAAVFLLLGDWRALARSQFRLPLLTLFLLGETLVWSAYSPYMSAAFRVGVYVLHIAAASFFHYLSSYLFANRRAGTGMLSPWAILLMNAVFVALGCSVARFGVLYPLRFVLAPEWFTLWVALHLAGSDLLPWWRKRR